MLPTTSSRIGVRWTIGDVSSHGFEALHLSIKGLRHLLPETTEFAVCVNGLSVAEARDRVGDVGIYIQWIDSAQFVPNWLTNQVDTAMAEGVAWKLAPVRVFPHLHELALDNDVILWQLPPALEHWLHSDDPQACLMAEDAQRCLGQFADHCDGRCINSGIRGLPPGLPYEDLICNRLQKSGLVLRSELDEQGLQAATLCQLSLDLVSKEDVTICSAFPMHQHHLGRCGVHFVGVNQKWLPYIIDGQPAHEAISRNFERLRPEILDKLAALQSADAHYASHNAS